MCRQFAEDLDSTALADAWDAQYLPTSPWLGAYSISPTNQAPILFERLDHTGALERSLTLGVFGFRPPATEPGHKPEPLRYNARSETIRQIPIWREQLVENRCVVTMSGYFEFTGPQGSKQAHYLYRRDSRQLGAAAIYRRSQGAEGIDIFEFSIVTRPGLGEAGEIHDRMPAFLSPSAIEQWIQPRALDSAERASLMELVLDDSAALAGHITSHPVGPAIKNTRTANPADPALIQPM